MDMIYKRGEVLAWEWQAERQQRVHLPCPDEQVWAQESGQGTLTQQVL
jgi:hypothetical protein